MTKKRGERQKIPDTTKLQLWVRAAGRCEFKGCNEPVWQNGLTLSDGNFAEVAHIIAASPGGPRADENSERLQIEFSNLMLLCQRCHKEIDTNPKKYPAKLLARWKQQHENRIEIQTAYPEEIHRTTLLQCQINIGERIVPINAEAVRNAMFPKYPTNRKGIKIEETDFDIGGAADYWQSFAETKIRRKLLNQLQEGVDDEKIKHLSIFAIAPIPLLMYLGKCIGDTVPTDIYQSHRNIEDTSQTWTWQADAPKNSDFIVHELKITESDEVYLILAVSDFIKPDKYDKLCRVAKSVYEITVDEPSTLFLKSRKQLENFGYEYRKLLNRIQAAHGKNCRLTILPAVPVAIAIECGRSILPGKDPEIFVANYYRESGEFRRVLRIN